MTDTPLISVLVANYNGMAVIDDCLSSVIGQEGGLGVEVIVHDDASMDGSAAYIREQYPRVSLIESPENVGFCVANNRMADAARGDYLLLLNNDAALFPDALRTLHAEAVRLGRPAILGLPQYDAETGELLDIGSLLDPFLNPVPNKDPERGEVGMVMGSCLWIPRRLWDELGGFPDWFGSIGEDLYLCSSARLRGVPVRASAVSGYRHRVGGSFGGGKLAGRRMVTTFRRRALSERNKTLVMLLCYPAPLLGTLLPLHLLLLLLEGLLLAAVRRDRLIWRAVYAPIIPAIWNLRKKWGPLRRNVQRDRQIGIRAWLSAFHWWPHKLSMLGTHGLPVVR